LRAAGSVRGLDLDKVDHLEPVRAQQPDPIPVAEVELDRRGPSASLIKVCLSSRCREKEHTLTPAWQR
jgi:hypothetical protein